MLFNKLDKEYLSGVQFSNGRVFQFSKDNNNYLYRDDYLLDITKNKKVIHLGFVDHLPLIEKKISENSWLHKKLIDNCQICYGIDINKAGIEYIKDKYNYNNLYALDIVKDTIPNELSNAKIDYLLIPDVIEHIGNPVAFLSVIRERFKNNVDEMILTTPNAFRLNNFINSFKNIENINTDHRFWFTPYTLSKIAMDAGFKINSLRLGEHSFLSRRQIIRKFIISKYPLFRDTLILNLK